MTTRKYQPQTRNDEGTEASRMELRPSSIRIRLESEIGQGLTSTVYRGVREDNRGHTRQRVAVKVVKNRAEIEVLRREFETLSQVESPHLVRVFAWDNHGEMSSISMEWIDGVSLADLFEDEALDLEVTTEIIAQAQAGLRALNQKSLHHGDFSPGNILINRQGIVKLIDFANPNRESGFVHGTPPFMAPEIWLGQPSSIYADLFALGVIELDLHRKIVDPGYRWPDDQASAHLRCMKLVRQNEDHAYLAERPEHRAFIERTSSSAAIAKLAAMVERRLENPVDPMSAFRPGSAKASRRRVAISKPLPRRSRPGLFRARAKLALFSCFAFFLAVCASDHPLAVKEPLVVAPTLIQTLGVRHVDRMTAVPHPDLPMKMKHENVAPQTSTSAGVKPSVDVTLQIRTLKWMHFELDGVNLGYSPIKMTHVPTGKHRLRWVSESSSGEILLKANDSNSGARSIQLRDHDFISPSRL